MSNRTGHPVPGGLWTEGYDRYVQTPAAEQQEKVHVMWSNDIEDRLENWGLVLRWRKQFGQSPSMEGAYRSPQRDHWEAPNSHSPTGARADPADADLIESAVCMLDLRYHAILRAWYVRKAKPASLIRLATKLGFRHPRMADVEAARAMGKALLVKALEVPSVVRKQRAKDWVERMLAVDRLTSDLEPA